MAQFKIEDLYFSAEAASYLSISVQRLNQLVRSEKLFPIKRTAGCMLFSKEDLDLRKLENKNISIDANEEMKDMVSQKRISSPIWKEAIVYFAIQSFFNYSDKKSFPIFEQINGGLDFLESTEPVDYAQYVSQKINCDVDEFIKRLDYVEKSFRELQSDVKILKYDDNNYPKQLKKINDYPPFIFARGNLDLLEKTIIAVVGSREPSKDGALKAYQLSQLLGRSDIVVSSGLAKGIDTNAHKAALDSGKPTIAVIGTPINRVYPKENKLLQNEIVNQNGLVLSQFAPNEKVQRWFFPLRNGTMSGISRATVIVEAGETSGALKQADYALKQGRLVFIPKSAVDDSKIKWPKTYIRKKGAYKFHKLNELLTVLNDQKVISDQVKEKGIAQLSLFEE